MSTLFPPELLQDAKALLSELQRLALRVAVAESCTGGLLIGRLTEIPGASATVERGFVTYSNAAKSSLLGVEARLIAKFGAVSEEVARAMAEGALARAPVDIAISVTGIAGPDGGSADKPVGLVYLAEARKARRRSCANAASAASADATSALQACARPLRWRARH
jgi:nicotinamide-nucleotide amidase